MVFLSHPYWTLVANNRALYCALQSSITSTNHGNVSLSCKKTSSLAQKFIFRWSSHFWRHGVIVKFFGRLFFTLVFGSNPLFFPASIIDNHFPKKTFFLLFLDVIAINYSFLSLLVFIWGWNDSVHEKYWNWIISALRDPGEKRERKRTRPKKFSIPRIFLGFRYIPKTTVLLGNGGHPPRGRSTIRRSRLNFQRSFYKNQASDGPWLRRILFLLSNSIHLSTDFLSKARLAFVK